MTQLTNTLMDDSQQTGDMVEATLPGLLLLWSRDEPARAGEVTLLPKMAIGLIGRGESGEPPMLRWTRQRPGQNRDTGPLTSPRLSRRQLLVTRLPEDALRIRNVGRPKMLVDGRVREQATLRPGDMVEVERRALFLCVRRPATLPGEARHPHVFGEADPWGYVGESPIAWALRDQLGFIARRSAHVLLRGDSGSGKELAARSIHARSPRAKGPLVSRSAATLPEGLLDAELFGNLKDFPNPGMPARPGLIGAADGGTLFLDEVGELPEAMQAHLLRVLDRGEFHRLGESAGRRADLRLVAATNRPSSVLKHDLLARLSLRIELPGLNERLEDIPLLVRHLLRSVARRDSELAERFFDDGADGQPRLRIELVRALVQHRYTTHARELMELLWQAIAGSRGDRIEAIDGPARPTEPGSLGKARLLAALEQAGGVKTQAAELLGLSDRHQLRRLLKKHGLE